MKKERIIIATIKSWNVDNASLLEAQLRDKFDFFIFTKKEELTYERVEEIGPKYIFLPHWSWIIPKSIHEKFSCVVFHMTDLPFGRGGSPLQNLINNKIYETKISAIKVDVGVDTGAIYRKENFWIGLGSAEEIYQKASELIFTRMIPYILENDPVPIDQQGEAVSFRRRAPEESDIGGNDFLGLDDLYDFIRMLDAEGYPKAFLRVGNLKIEFSEVRRTHGKLTGRFEVESGKK